MTSFPTFISALHFSPQDGIPSVAFAPTPGKRREVDEEKPMGRGREFIPKRMSPVNGTNILEGDSDRYFYARRKLKKAVLEHYRHVLGGHLR